MGKCYKYDYVKIGTHQTKYKDDKMTSDKCNEYAQEKSTDDKTLKYLSKGVFAIFTDFFGFLTEKFEFSVEFPF